jgi:hypothetical protein
MNLTKSLELAFVGWSIIALAIPILNLSGLAFLGSAIILVVAFGLFRSGLRGHRPQTWSLYGLMLALGGHELLAFFLLGSSDSRLVQVGFGWTYLCIAGFILSVALAYLLPVVMNTGWAWKKEGETGWVKLLDGLQNPDAEIRAEAVQLLGKMGDMRAAELLISVLQDEDDNVRADAVQAFSRLGPAAIAKVRDVLQDRNSPKRAEAAHALGMVGGTQAVEPLLDALTDADWEVRHQAAEALGKLGDRRAVGPLMNLLTDTNAEVRACAAWALGDIGDPQALPVLERIRQRDTDLDANGQPVQDTAAAAIRRIEASSTAGKRK